MVKFRLIASGSSVWIDNWLWGSWRNCSNLAATDFLYAVNLLSRDYGWLVAILCLESGLRDEIYEGGLIQILDGQRGKSLFEGVKLHDEWALYRAKIKFEFSWLLIHPYIDHFSKINIHSSNQFILVWSTLADQKQLDDGFSLQKLKFGVIEEHLKLKWDACIEIDLVFMWCVAIGFGCALWVDGSPFYEIGAWKFHGYVGLADEALKSTQVNWCLDLLLLKHVHYKII